MTQEEEAIAMVKTIYEDSNAEINGRSYKLTKTTHLKRRVVFAFFSKATTFIDSGDYSFLESPEFAKVEEVINNIVTFEGSLISKLPDHWEKYPEDYMLFISTMMAVLSYPFLVVKAGS